MNERTPVAHISHPTIVFDVWAKLVDAIEQLSAAHELSSIVAAVIEAARRLSGADGVTFVLRDGERCHYLDEDAIGPLWKGRKFPMSTCISGWCMLNRQTAIVPDIYEDERIPHDAYRPTFVKSLVMVPVGGEEPLAAIGIYWARQGVPQAETVLALETLARSAATALAGASRHQSLVKRVDELAALYQLTDKLYRAQSLSDIYEAAMAAILSVLECSRASILTFDETGAIRFVAWRGLSENYRRAIESRSPWNADVQEVEPILIADVDAAAELRELNATLKGENIRALALIPLMARGAVFGRFVAYYDTPHVFSAGEADLAVSIARQLGFSIERIWAEQARQIAEVERRRNEERLRLATQTGKIGIWEWDIAADRISWTDSLYAIHGVEKTNFGATVEDFAALVHPDDGERVSQAIDRALRDSAPYELEFRAVKPDGQVVWIYTNAIVLRDNGKPVRMVGASLDITDRKQMEERLAEKSAQLDMIMQTVPAIIWIAHDPEAKYITGSRYAAEFIRMSTDSNHSLSGPGSDRPRHFRLLKNGEELAEDELPVQRAAQGEIVRNEELEIVFTDGSSRWEIVNASPIRDSEGNPIGAVGAGLDITERKEAEAHRKLLIDELDHRVKNTLAIVQGIAQQTFRMEALTAEARSAFEGRLAALASAHNLLARANWKEASFAELVDQAMIACGTARHRVTLSGPGIQLQPMHAGTIAIALHELCTNALKYGALSNESGTVNLEWSVHHAPQPRLKMVWRESGGPPVSPPKRKGFGSRMIEQALAQELDGDVSMEFEARGLVCTIDAPLLRA